MGPRFVNAAVASIAVLMLAVGCAGYRSGAGSLYAPDIHTVYVPMIESDSFRRDLGERLTEAVVKEIELKTPFKVVATPNADSLLEIRLLGDSRATLAEDATDNPRLQENHLRAEVAWRSRRQMPLAAPQTIALPGAFAESALPPGVADLVGVSQRTPLIHEAGQTLASQQQLAIQRLAEQIVATMEEPW